MEENRTSLAVFDALGRLGIAADLMEIETTEKTRPWQEALVRLALAQGPKTDEDRRALENFLDGGTRMNKSQTPRHWWTWTWTNGVGMVYADDMSPVGVLESWPSREARDAAVAAHRMTEAITAHEAYGHLRRSEGTHQKTMFRERRLDLQRELGRALTDRELLEAWDWAHARALEWDVE